MGFRFIFLTALFGIIFGLLGLNLFRLQIENGGYYFARAEARNQALAQSNLTRGQIFFTDRSGNKITVAMDQPYPVIYAVPQEIADPSSTAAALAPAIGWDPGALAKALDNPKSLFRMLIEKATPTETDAVTALNLSGIYTDEKDYRYYPFGTLAAQVVGFVGLNSSTSQPAGLYGLENQYNAELAAGTDLQTTIDRTLQAQSEEILQNLMTARKAEGGTIIIEDPKTGAILTFANSPTFDPNAYASSSVSTFIDPGTEYFYEPGSVFKAITMAIGIDDDIFTSSTTYTDPGYVVLNGKKITNYDHKAYGPGTTMTGVIMHSINTGAVWAEQQIGSKLFSQGVFNFGFGSPTGIDLPNEIGGRTVNLTNKNAEPVDFATVGFGQGIGVTPIQMVNAYAALANGGLLMRPYVNAALGPEVVRRVISPATAKEVTLMIQIAAENGGVANIPSFHVAGKTGTAQIPDLVHGGYTQNYIHTFVGMVPATDPRLVILLKLDNPDVGDLAALTVVPAFRQLASFAMNYLNVTPDNPNNIVTKP